MKTDSPKGNGKKGRTVYFSKRQVPNAAKWVLWLDKNCLASAGPHPNICGMRNLYWGKEALIVKTGSYAYLITCKDDGRKLPWE